MATSHKVLRQPSRTRSTPCQVVQRRSPCLARQFDKWSRLPSVIANQVKFRLMRRKPSDCRHPPQPSSWSSERKYCMPASSLMPAISPPRNFSFSSWRSGGPSCLLSRCLNSSPSLTHGTLLWWSEAGMALVDGGGGEAQQQVETSLISGRRCNAAKSSSVATRFSSRDIFASWNLDQCHVWTPFAFTCRVLNG